jgi:hypothetical protein
VLTPHIGGSTTEAQYQVALDAAAQVIDVLHDRPARYAINAPLIPSSDIEFITPFIGLLEKMGRFLHQFQPMQVERMELTVHGPLAEYDTTILQAAALRGLLADVVEERVNVVNADYIAHRRGVIISEYRQRHHYERYENMVTLTVRSGEEKVSVKGSVLHGDPYIVAVADRWVEFQPEGNNLVSWHQDKPGVIGGLAIASLVQDGGLLGHRGEPQAYRGALRRWEGRSCRGTRAGLRDAQGAGRPAGQAEPENPVGGASQARHERGVNE